MAQFRLAALALQAATLNPQLSLSVIAEPRDLRHMGLRFRSECIGPGAFAVAVVVQP